MSNITKVLYSNNDMKGDLLSIIRQIQESNWAPDFILGIGRGGYVPAVYLSQWFSKPLVALHVSLRDMQRDEIISVDLKRDIYTKNVLIVDDICDSGETLALVDDKLADIQCNTKTAVLINNIGQDVFDPDFFGREINKTEKPCWIVYPWEEWWYWNIKE
jgi:hypoxanthine phosphoribosyltransferase